MRSVFLVSHARRESPQVTGVPVHPLGDYVHFDRAHPAIKVWEGAHPSWMVDTMAQSAVVWCYDVLSLAKLTIVVGSPC